jgi:hypothetical protein
MNLLIKRLINKKNQFTLCELVEETIYIKLMVRKVQVLQLSLLIFLRFFSFYYPLRYDFLFVQFDSLIIIQRGFFYKDVENENICEESVNISDESE